MADWSQLPRELLDLISNHLFSDTDLLRFRSVCTSWRSSTQPFSSRFPILPRDGISNNTWGFYLSKRTIFRIGSTHPDCQQTHPPWLIKVERDSSHKTHFMNPLTGSEFIPLLPNFPRSLDLMNLRVTELGQEYVLQYITYRPNANSIEDSVSLYAEKVAFCGVGVHGFVLLTIHVSGKLVMFKNGEKKWNMVDDLPSSSPYDDVMFYKGEFYAVDSSGRAATVDSETMSPKVVATAMPGGDKKYLVESMGELFMVDVYLTFGPDNGLEDDDDVDDDENFEFNEHDDCVGERAVKLKVYKLNPEEQNWIEVKDLGDRMLFLGDNCRFSASASEFPGCRGNCVFFTGQNKEDDVLMKDICVSVFDLESGSIGSVPNDSGYSRLYWPPPRWLHSNPLPLEDGLGELNI